MTAKENAPRGTGGAIKAATRSASNVHNQAHSNIRPVYSATGRVCGEIAGPVLKKNAQPNHMLRRPAGWGWDKAILEEARGAGCTHTEITCRGVVYRAALANFTRYGVKINRGYGEQVILPLMHWQQRKPGDVPTVQLGLFDRAEDAS